jgi:hypothetical protein
MFQQQLKMCGNTEIYKARSGTAKGNGYGSENWEMLRKKEGF